MYPFSSPLWSEFESPQKRVTSKRPPLTKRLLTAHCRTRLTAVGPWEWTRDDRSQNNTQSVYPYVTEILTGVDKSGSGRQGLQSDYCHTGFRSSYVFTVSVIYG